MKKNFFWCAVNNILVDSFTSCRRSVELAKSLIMSGMCLGMLCSTSRLFARMPSFRCSEQNLGSKAHELTRVCCGY